MRETGVVAKYYAGDTTVAAGHTQEALTQLGILKNLMSFNKLQQLSRTVQLPDGSEVFVQSVFGRDEIRITSPKSSSSRSEAPKFEEQLAEVKFSVLVTVPNPVEPPDYTPCAPDFATCNVASSCVLDITPAIYCYTQRQAMLNAKAAYELAKFPYVLAGLDIPPEINAVDYYGAELQAFANCTNTIPGADIPGGDGNTVYICDDTPLDFSRYEQIAESYTACRLGEFETKEGCIEGKNAARDACAIGKGAGHGEWFASEQHTGADFTSYISRKRADIRDTAAAIANEPFKFCPDLGNQLGVTRENVERILDIFNASITAGDAEITELEAENRSEVVSEAEDNAERRVEYNRGVSAAVVTALKNGTIPPSWDFVIKTEAPTSQNTFRNPGIVDQIQTDAADNTGIFAPCIPSDYSACDYTTACELDHTPAIFCYTERISFIEAKADYYAAIFPYISTGQDIPPGITPFGYYGAQELAWVACTEGIPDVERLPDGTPSPTSNILPIGNDITINVSVYNQISEDYAACRQGEVAAKEDCIAGINELRDKCMLGAGEADGGEGVADAEWYISKLRAVDDLDAKIARIRMDTADIALEISSDETRLINGPTPSGGTLGPQELFGDGLRTNQEIYSAALAAGEQAIAKLQGYDPSTGVKTTQRIARLSYIKGLGTEDEIKITDFVTGTLKQTTAVNTNGTLADSTQNVWSNWYVPLASAAPGSLGDDRLYHSVVPDGQLYGMGLVWSGTERVGYRADGYFKYSTSSVPAYQNSLRGIMPNIVLNYRTDIPVEYREGGGLITWCDSAIASTIDYPDIADQRRLKKKEMLVGVVPFSLVKGDAVFGMFGDPLDIKEVDAIEVYGAAMFSHDYVGGRFTFQGWTPLQDDDGNVVDSKILHLDKLPIPDRNCLLQYGPIVWPDVIEDAPESNSDPLVRLINSAFEK